MASVDLVETTSDIMLLNPLVKSLLSSYMTQHVTQLINPSSLIHFLHFAFSTPDSQGSPPPHGHYRFQGSMGYNYIVL